MEDYRRIADAVAESIATGRLRPGDRLPPQRAFARRHGIANSTAARVYGDLMRRGLTVGEVGRGTFVRATAQPRGPALAEPADHRIDLELNYPVAPGQAAQLATSLGGLLRPDVLESAMRPMGAAGTPAARDAAARLLSRGGWRPDPAQVLFAGNGRQAIAAAMAALVPAGCRLGVEELTYPVLKAIAGRLGVTLVPLAVDDAGLVPEAITAAHRTAPLRAVYLQPTLHNPLSSTMPEKRRNDVAGLLTGLGLSAIEDTIWAFLRDDLPPLAALAPAHTVLIDSLSKRLAPGLTAGFAVPPAPVTADVAAALRSGGWTPMSFALDAATRWTMDGTTHAITQAKRQQVTARQQIAARCLDEFSIRSDPNFYYCWWELPRRWRADTFVAAAARHGIAVTPAAAFAVGMHQVPNAIRLGLASPEADTLSQALTTLAELARRAPDDLTAD